MPGAQLYRLCYDCVGCAALEEGTLLCLIYNIMDGWIIPPFPPHTHATHHMYMPPRQQPQQRTSTHASSSRL